MIGHYRVEFSSAGASYGILPVDTASIVRFSKKKKGCEKIEQKERQNLQPPPSYLYITSSLPISRTVKHMLFSTLLPQKLPPLGEREKG